jgi:hypothetical protein
MEILLEFVPAAMTRFYVFVGFRAARPLRCLWAGAAVLLLWPAGCVRKDAIQPAPSVPVEVDRPQFRDVALESGIEFRWGPKNISPVTALDAFGHGCAFLDANRDGWLDVLVVGEPTCGLFLNEGGTHFENATERSRLNLIRGSWKGCAVGDYDSDGRLDILLTGYNSIALLHAEADGTYRDVTRTAGLRPTGWSSSAGFMDLDSDGYLDLFIGNYVVYDQSTPHYCDVNGIRSGCPPQTYSPQYPRLYHNERNGTFRDVTESSGLAGHMRGKSLVVAFADYNEDGRMDFFVGNDGMRDDLFRNIGGMKFTNDALASGVAMGVYQQAQATMGADWADFDGDGKLDLVASKFSGEPASLFTNCGAFFTNTTRETGLADATLMRLSFGVKFADVDNDGWPDILFANGSVYDTANRIDPRTTYRQPAQLFMNRAGRHAEDISSAAGEVFTRPILGRGVATGDFDNDGKVDFLVVDDEGRALLLHNESANNNHWLEVVLDGSPPNWAAYGAQVTLKAGKRTWVQQVSPASSYLSSSSPWLHFGLGDRTSLDSVDVHWPNGAHERYKLDVIDRRVTFVQGKGARQ